MCLGIPGRITAVDDDAPLRQGVVDFGGTTREVCLAYVPEAGLGDWVLVHVGFAIARLSEQEARDTLVELQALAEVQALEEMRRDGPAGGAPGAPQ